MKAKKLFFGALTCLAFAACSNDDDPIANGGVQAEGENTFVAVQLVMAGTSSSTRAWNEDADDDTHYATGNENELAVQDATFFFFDASGNPVQDAATYTIQKSSDGNSNTVDDIYKAYIVITGKMPAEIAAVVNMPEAAKTALASATKSMLIKSTSTENYNWAGAKNKTFVMSNAVYNDKNTEATTTYFATPVTSANIIKSDKVPTVGSEYDGAVDPVVITVERVLARVDVDYKKTNGEASLTYTDNSVTTNTSTGAESTEIEITPFITGWWLHNTNKDSYLFKDLSTNYTFTQNEGKTAQAAGWWNDADDFRSYWANAVTNKGYNAYRYSTANMNAKYCFENTDNNDENATTLMVAAILKARNSEGDWETVNLIQWMDFNFTSKENCLIYLADYLNKNQYSNNGTDLTMDDLEFVYNNDTEAQENAADGNSKNANTYNWQTRVIVKSSVTLQKDGQTISDPKTELINKIGYLKYYNGGQTYYFTKIAHEPAYSETDYAIIRNHKYVVTINGITGLGTPVPNPEDGNPTDPTDPTPDPDPENPEYPDPTDPTPDPDPENPDPDQPLDPETPTNDYSAISAKVQVLKYRIVSQDVTLDNQK